MERRLTQVLVIGSGFAAQTLARALMADGIRVLTADLSLPERIPAISFEPGSSTTFNPVLANRTAVVGGGLGVWGRAVTPVTSHNYLENIYSRGLDHASEEDVGWNTIARQLDLRRLHRPFKNKRVCLSSRSLWTAEHLTALSKSSLTADFHYYAKEPTEVSWNGNPIQLASQPKRVVAGTLNSIENTTDNRWKTTITLSDSAGSVDVESNIVVIASGPLMNAALVSSLSGVKKFPLGNHLSARDTVVDAGRRRRLGPLAQTYGLLDSKFATFSLSADVRGRESLGHSAGRLQPVNDAKAGNLSSRFASKLGIGRFFRLNLMADYQIDHGGFIEFDDSVNGRWEARVSCPTPDALHQELHQLEHQIVEWLESTGLAASITMADSGKASLEIASNYKLYDAAHYFGTVRASANPVPGQVDTRQELAGCPGIFVVGLSSVSKGNHSHPTGLAVSLALLAAEAVLDKLRS